MKYKSILCFSFALINLKNLKNLTLDLFASNITNRGAKYLFTSLTKLTNLISLNLSMKYNYLSKEGAFQ